MHTRDVAVRIQRVGQHTLPLPAYETEGAAGMDLRASLLDLHSICSTACSVSYGTETHPETGLPAKYVRLYPGTHVYFPVGFAFSIPKGYEGQVRPRSGLAKNHHVVAWHPIGTVDSDYRGEVLAALHNRGDRPFTVWDGDRIAQLVIAPVSRATLIEVAALDDTARGTNGFGSTGTK